MAHDDDSTEGEGPRVDDVLGALEQALGGLDVHGLKEAVKKGLEEAARAIDPDEVEVEVHVETETERHGGGEREGGDDDNVVALDPHREAAAEEDPERVAVQVLTGGIGQGRLRLDDGWQTVWSGHEARDYRLSLSRGQLEVVADDQTVAQLLPGQTTDVAGRAIRVRGTGRGHYRRL